jgi:hypothetical protein
VAGAALLVGGVVAVDHRGLPGPPASAVSTAPWGPRPLLTPTTIPTVTSSVRSLPVTLAIPAIGVSVGLSTLGLNADGTVQVPTDVARPGWFDLGPTPGQLGSAVILGHVDSTQGPAVFFRLADLVPGDPVTVVLADGSTARFVVTSTVQYLKTGFPDLEVYGNHGSSELQLVTCGGAFDSGTGHYLSNVVVYTSLVGSTPA